MVKIRGKHTYNIHSLQAAAELKTVGTQTLLMMMTGTKSNMAVQFTWALVFILITVNPTYHNSTSLHC
jgi:hypothetical protein